MFGTKTLGEIINRNSIANKRFSVGRSKRAGGLGDGGRSPRKFTNFRLFEGLK